MQDTGLGHFHPPCLTGKTMIVAPQVQGAMDN
jgi:hypothetical protein